MSGLRGRAQTTLCDSHSLGFFALCLAGTSTTKDVLESTFNHLKDLSSRHAKNQKFGYFTRWLYAVCAPYGKESAPQLLPSKADWFTYRSADVRLLREFNGLGNVKGQRMPEIRYGEDQRFPQRPDEIKFRNAGPLSHHKSAAALAYAMEDAGSEFANVRHAWLGALFTAGQCFLHTTSGEYFMSLGFRKWSALGARLNKVTSRQGQDWLRDIRKKKK